MNKILQILLGVLLILVLAYLSFLEVSDKIKDDLLKKSQTKFVDKGIVDISAKIEGEGLSLTRTIILTGVTGSEKERNRIASLIAKIEGVGSVKNEIVVKARCYTIPEPTPVVVVPKVEVIVPVAKEVIKAVIMVEDEPTVIKKIEVSPIDEVKLKKKIEAIEVTSEASMSPAMKVQVPSVPVATQGTVTVPTPIKVTTVPVAVEAVNIEEETKKIKIQGEK